MRRVYLLAGSAVFMLALFWSASWIMGPTRVSASDLQCIWGGEPAPTPTCYGSTSCGCSASVCAKVSQGGVFACVQTVVNKATFDTCIDSSVEGQDCVAQYPQPQVYCAMRTNSPPTKLPGAPCVWGNQGQYCGLQPPNSSRCTNAVSVPTSGTPSCNP